MSRPLAPEHLNGRRSAPTDSASRTEQSQRYVKLELGRPEGKPNPYVPIPASAAESICLLTLLQTDDTEPAGQADTQRVADRLV